MGDAIRVNSADLKKVAADTDTALTAYKTNYSKLTAVIQEITNGGFKGELANDFLNKYDAKKDTFDGITKTLDTAEEYLTRQGTNFEKMMADVEMR